MAAYVKPSYSLSRPFLFRPLTHYFYNPIKRYSKEERAPSLAEEFRRVAEERAKSGDVNHHGKEEQGIGSQSFDKAVDATRKAVTGDSDNRDAKNEYEKHEPGSGKRGN